MKSTLDKFGRVVIPKKFREELGLQPGDAVEIEESSQGLVLKPERTTGELVIREGVLIYHAAATEPWDDNLEKTIRETRNGRLDKLGFTK